MIPGEDAGRDGPDWTELAFDDAFVASATVTELSAEERLRNAERDRRARELEARLEDQRRHVERRGRQRRRRRGVRAVLACTAVFAIGFLTVRLAGTSSSGNGFPLGADGLAATLHGSTRPTPQVAASSEPLDTPPPLPTGTGNYHFLAMQPDRDEPVTYDPCREIRFVVNDEQVPAGGDDLLTSAVAMVSDATGLEFRREGATDERPRERRAPFQPNEYGDRWAPVVVWWSQPSLAPTLSGAVAGYAGSTYVETDTALSDATRTYVSGVVVLDGPQLAQIIARSPEGRDSARAVIAHELAHLVGLDHVADPSQLMNPEATELVTSFGAGDLRGLNELGRGRCVAAL